MNDPDMDPIEWTVRKIVPIPKQYYWEILQNNNASSSSAAGSNNINNYNHYSHSSNANISYKIKFWHNLIYLLMVLYQFCNTWIATPIGDTLGITSSSTNRYVNHGITDEDYENSKINVQNRKKKQQLQQQQNNNDNHTITDTINNDNDNDDNKLQYVLLQKKPPNPQISQK